MINLIAQTVCQDKPFRGGGLRLKAAARKLCFRGIFRKAENQAAPRNRGYDKFKEKPKKENTLWKNISFLTRNTNFYR